MQWTTLAKANQWEVYHEFMITIHRRLHANVHQSIFWRSKGLAPTNACIYQSSSVEQCSGKTIKTRRMRRRMRRPTIPWRLVGASLERTLIFFLDLLPWSSFAFPASRLRLFPLQKKKVPPLYRPLAVIALYFKLCPAPTSFRPRFTHFYPRYSFPG